MIGILKFKLPEEEREFLDAQKAQQYIAQLQEFDNYLHDRLKLENDLSARVIVKNIRKRLHKLVEGIWE